MKPYSIVPALALIAHTAFAAEGLPREIQALSQQPCEEIRKEMTEDLRECRLAHAGAVGTVDEHEFFFAVYHVALKGLESPAPEYCLGDPTPQTYFCEASALFERYHGQSRLFKTFWTGDIGLMHYDRPRIVVREGAPILYIPIPWDGTGHGNGSEYYVWNGEWRLIDSTQWLKELTQRLPTGLTIM